MTRKNGAHARIGERVQRLTGSADRLRAGDAGSPNKWVMGGNEHKAVAGSPAGNAPGGLDIAAPHGSE